MAETISLDEYNALIQNQCPMPPREYKYINSEDKQCSITTTAWYYKDKFWIKETDSNNIFPVILRPKEYKKYVTRINCMRTVDEYLSNFQLTTSVHIYQMMKTAINQDAASNATHGALKGNKAGKITNASKYAKKFNPKWSDRFGLLTVIFRAILNAYFIVTNFVTITEVPTEWQPFVWIVVAMEAILWLIAFVRTLYNLWSLLKRVCRGDTTHYQVKNIPDNLRLLGSLSVMRYLPNGEQLGMLHKRGSEWYKAKKASYKFEVSNARNYPCLVRIRWIIMTFFDIIGPVVAVFSLLFKMAQLNFNFDNVFDEDLYQTVLNVVSYFAFVNQVAGIRKVRQIEIDALEHFIFSGADIKLSQEENILLDVWWNYTLVSCVANICDEFRFPVYDSMIFWYQLNGRRIQLLFKDHSNSEGDQFIDKSGDQFISQIDLTKYDKEIVQLATPRSANTEKELLTHQKLNEAETNNAPITSQNTMDSVEEMKIEVAGDKDTKEKKEKEAEAEADEE